MPGSEDLFTPIHKGLRAMLYDLSGRVQTHDFQDVEATQRLATQLESDFEVARSAGCALCIMSHHATDEDTFIFAPAAQHANALVTELIRDHRQLYQQELDLARQVHAIAAMAGAEERVRAGVVLNQGTNALLGAYLVHMNREEEELVPILQANFTDPEQAAMRGAIIARLPPDRIFAILGWMLPALNAEELVTFLTSIRAGAPPPLMQKVVDLASARVDPARWQTVRTRMGL